MTKREADIRIDDVGRRGDGVGFFNGRPAFIPGALPGEVVRARLDADRGEGHAGRLLAVLEASPERVTPPCPYYDTCGGCSLQHWSDGAYRAWTEKRVRTMLARNDVAVGAWRDSVYVPPRTRRRATFAALMVGGRLHLGFHKERSHHVADIPDCLVLSPRLQALMNGLRAHLPHILNDGREAAIFAQDSGSALDVMITGQIGARREPQMREREALATMAQDCGIARLSWRFKERDDPEIMIAGALVLKRSGALAVPLPPGAFLQPSMEGEAALLAAVLAPLQGMKRGKVADLFAGCGTFAGPFLDYGVVHAVEGDEAAIAALQSAARGVSGLSVEKRNLFTDPLGPRELDKFDAVVFDPPRAGALAQATQIAQSKVPLAIGVSCNMATFARDAGVLLKGGYTLRSLQIVDQFTWSAHVELVGVFTR